MSVSQVSACLKVGGGCSLDRWRQEATDPPGVTLEVFERAREALARCGKAVPVGDRWAWDSARGVSQ